MFEHFSLQFEEPLWLLLIVLVLPAYALARRSIGGLSPLKTHITFALRAVVIAMLAMSLARPLLLKQGEGLTVMVVLDRSRSIPYPVQHDVLEYLRVATDDTLDVGRQRVDRLGIITVGRQAAISALPSSLTTFSNFGDNVADHDATNLAEGIALALASAPHDTAIRIVLASDGNENLGSVIEAARVAKANGIPIDVLPVRYSLDREVIFDRIVSPARAREGQVHNLRLIIRAQAPTSGTISLAQNGVPYDLDPGAVGDGMHVDLQPGLNTLTVPIVFDRPGPQQFSARFVPDDPTSDLIVENNVATAVTFVGGEGRVLIINDSLTEVEVLTRALEASDLRVDVLSPTAVDSQVMLAGYDAVILANVNRGVMNSDQDRWLHDYVHDLGGGLIMIGGIHSFGSGGWINTQVERAMPLKFDPPQNYQRQRGALALIMHSCEMPQGNFWSEKVAESAINALSSQDYVGIICFNWQRGGCVWEFPMGPAGDKTGPLSVLPGMIVGDMPDFGPSLEMALTELSNVNAKRHAIIISDGDPQAPSNDLIRRIVNAQITVTAVLVAGHGWTKTMEDIADRTGGNFYNVTNPRNLPEIFIDEARLVARSLIVEGQPFTPLLRNPLAEPIRGFTNLPPVDGYVLTAPKEGLAEIPFIENVNGDPIYANWVYGIGKSIAFTPDLSGRWGSRWIAWDEFKGFWDQSVRWVMRPVAPPNMTVTTQVEGERAVIEVEALDTDETFLNFLQPTAAVLGPVKTNPLTMRQVAPGRYRGEFDLDEAGSYLVNMNFRRDGEVIGNLQAAVNVPYAREFRDVFDNRAKMLKVAEISGGRDIAAMTSDPVLAGLWDRSGLEARRSHKPIWDLLAIIAAAIFLFDVAARRLSIGIAEMRKGLQRLLGKTGEVSEDTVAAWKRAREQVAHRRDERLSKPTQPADAAVKFEADEDDRAQAIDVAAEGEGASSDRPDSAPKRRDREQPATPEADDGDYTSRLLAAKRRAREERNKDGGGDDA